MEKEDATARSEDTVITDDSSLLTGAIVRLFNQHFSEVLDVLSARFPHIAGDGSQNETEFQALRKKILRSGNNKIRKLPLAMKNYTIVQTHESDTLVMDIQTPVKIREQEKGN